MHGDLLNALARSSTLPASRSGFGYSGNDDRETATPMADIELVLLRGQPTMKQTPLAVSDAASAADGKLGWVTWTFTVPTAAFGPRSAQDRGLDPFARTRRSIAPRRMGVVLAQAADSALRTRTCPRSVRAPGAARSLVKRRSTSSRGWRARYGQPVQLDTADAHRSVVALPATPTRRLLSGALHGRAAKAA
jgi:hypothetical protein